MFERVIIICGMPRSGTSWLGQVFNSHEDVAFRMEPLFSYAFKNQLNINSNSKEIIRFFEKTYFTKDEFILQIENQKKGSYPIFAKAECPKTLVIKTTRHHEMLEGYLQKVPEIEIFSLIRHPCAVINSWANSYKEFSKKGCTLQKDWKTGACRKKEPGEYWGFNDWISVTRLHVDLADKYPNFHLIKYSNLLANTVSISEQLFSETNLEMGEQSRTFLQECNNRHVADPYSVYKHKQVEHKWKKELPQEIAFEILETTDVMGLTGYFA